MSQTRPPAPPAPDDLAARILIHVDRLCRHGSPDNPAIPSWPAYDAADRSTMIFDTECRITHDPTASRACCGAAYVPGR